jgi:hypothetical protein
MAGSRGDNQMQLREKVKEGETTGQLFGERRVQFLLSPSKEPIELRAQVVTSPDRLQARLSFELDVERKQWTRVDPSEQQRFLKLVSARRECPVVIHPHHRLRHDLAKVGWITSSYLLAFYTFGYRYIFHKIMDPVREYILCSFGDAVSEEIELPESVTLSVRECTEHHFSDPEIALVIPLDGESSVHLQVSLLDYHIRLPFHFVKLVLQELVFSQPGVAEMLPEVLGHEEAHFYSPICCNKLDGHNCIWDYVLGKPIPDAVE